MKTLKSVCLLLTVVAIQSCASQEKAKSSNPAGFNLRKPVKYTMPETLLEISGIMFMNGRPEPVYAVQDEEGALYHLRLGEKTAQKVQFEKKGDYEDLTNINETVVVLRSDGTLFSFPYKGITEKDLPVRKWTGLVPEEEYEGLFADQGSRQLYLLCKSCKTDKGNNTLSGYVLRMDQSGTIETQNKFIIQTDEIAALTGQKKLNFKPSALAINPTTGEWYILSSVNKLLVIADKNWKVKEVHPLDPGTFNQPEGMAFDTKGNLYISNEGDKTQNGSVLMFTYQQK